MPKRTRQKLEVLPTSELKEHEEVISRQVDILAEEIQKSGVIKLPILVEKGSLIILDGHHRFRALSKLGCSRIPCILVDYKNVSLKKLRTDTEVSKNMVIDFALSGRKFPAKTTHHIYKKKVEEINMAIDELK